MAKVTSWMGAGLYLREAFQGVMATIKAMGTVKRCPQCSECFVSNEWVLVYHLITNCGKEDVEFYSPAQIDREVARIEQLLGLKAKGEMLYIGAIADRILAETEPMGKCPDPC